MNKLKLWLRAVRPFAYPASAMPAVFGAALAYSDGHQFKPGLFILTLIGVLFTHTGANLLSDYFDFKSGLDTKDKMGGSGVLAYGLMNPRSFVVASAFFFAMALIVAFVIYLYVGNKILPLVAIGIVVGLLYSFPKIGFKYLAVGELAVLVAFGIGIGTGSYLVQSGVLSLRAAILSIPLGLYVAAILFANNVRDVEEDEKVALKSFASILGKRMSKIFYFLLIFLPYALIVSFVSFKVIDPWTFVSFASLPLAFLAAKKMWQSTSDISSLDAETARLCLVFGILLTAGVMI